MKVKHLDTSFATLVLYLTTFYSYHLHLLHFPLLLDYALTLLTRCGDPSSRRSGATPDASDPGFRRLSHLPRTEGYSSRQHCLCSALLCSVLFCCKHSRTLSFGVRSESISPRPGRYRTAFLARLATFSGTLPRVKDRKQALMNLTRSRMQTDRHGDSTRTPYKSTRSLDPAIARFQSSTFVRSLSIIALHFVARQGKT